MSEKTPSFMSLGCARVPFSGRRVSTEKSELLSRVRLALLHSLAPFTIVAGLFLSIGSASAYEMCTPFTVVSDPDGREVVFVDHGEAGKSIGDQRFASLKLIDESGEHIGDVYAVTSIHQTDIDGARDISSSNFTLNFPTGSILAFIPPGISAASSQDTARITVPRDAIIIGGSGAFANASGDIEMGVDQDKNQRTFMLNITCN